MTLRRTATAVLLLLCLVYAGCARMPVEGPVYEGPSDGAASTRQPSDIDPQPPQHGASQLDVVNGFLQAMTAWPISTTVAKEYLTADAARSWNPSAGTIVYSSFAPPSGGASGVHVHLSDAARLDSAGAWRGAVPTEEQTLDFKIVREDGEFRIVEPPNALIVPTGWFQQRFSQVSLYYFDQAARYLVPEPVFVPVGDQLPTALVSALLDGPPRRLRGVVRSFLPGGLSIGLSAPVDADGVADLALVGERVQPSEQEAQRLVAQLAATLREDPEITGFRVTVNDAPLRPGEGNRTYPVDLDRFIPLASPSGVHLYGVSRGRLVGGAPASLQPVEGPFGAGSYSLDRVAVAPDGQQAVAVSGGGTLALRAPISSEPHPHVRALVADATDLARPTIDIEGRVWLLDRRRHGARVWCADGARAREVDVPGVTGTDARQLLVSRDGTRLLGVVHHAGGDAVVGVRVATNSTGHVVRTLAPFDVPLGSIGRRVHAIAWAAPTTLAILMPTRPGSLYQVDIVPADGSTVGGDSLSTTVDGHVTGLAGSPDPDQPTYAVLRGSLVDVRTRMGSALSAHASGVGYAG